MATAQGTTAKPAASEERWWDKPLGDRLNQGLDRLFAGMSLLMKPPADGTEAWWHRPMADRINARLDAFGSALSRIERRDLVQVARQLGLDGPTIWPQPVLPPADGVVDPKAEISLLQAWQASRSNDPTLRAARAALAAASERVPQARSQLLPQVQLSVSRVNNDLSREGVNSLNQPLSTFDRYPSANDTLAVRQPLIRAQQFVGVQQAHSVRREAEAQFAREEQDASVRVVQAYLEVLLAQDNVRLIESQREFLESALAAAQRGLTAGVGTRTDVDAARARLDLNKAQALQVKQNLEMTRRQLQAFINRPFGAVRAVDGQRLNTLSLADRSIEDWMREAEAGNPDLRRLEFQRDSMALEMKKARAGHLPTLDLVAQHQRSRSENTLSPQSQYQNTSVGVQINVPLYSGGLVNSQTRQASAELERIEESMQALRNDLAVRVHREYRGVTEGLLKVQALQIAVESAEVALDSARKSVRAGVRTQVDVLNAGQQLTEAQRNLSEARYSLLASVVRLHALTGTGDEALVSRLNQYFRL